jgi:hypothetical protein
MWCGRHGKGFSELSCRIQENTSMTTSRTAFLSKPTGDAEIPRDALTYIQERNRQQSYNLVIRALKESSISQATLARRLGKGPEVISRLLSRPRNWEQDTLSELIFAISGGGVTYGIELPKTASEPLKVLSQTLEQLSSSGEDTPPPEAIDPDKNKGPIRPALSLATG